MTRFAREAAMLINCTTATIDQLKSSQQNRSNVI